MKHLTQVLSGIWPDNGYEFDLRERVYRGRSSMTTGGDQDQRPALSILEPKTINPGSYADEMATYRKDRWVVLLQGHAVLNVAGETVELGAGDYLFLPAGLPHTVQQVSAGALWLAVHLWPE